MSEKKRALRDVTVRKTRRVVDDIVWRLIDVAYDKSEDVRESHECSIRDLGFKQPELVMSSICNYIQGLRKKIALPHRVQLLQVLHQVLKQRMDELSEEMCLDLVDFCAAELSSSKDVRNDWQGTVSAIMIHLAHQYANPVIDSLLSIVKPGVEPHYFVMRTLVDVAAADGITFSVRLRDVLTRVTPILGAVEKSGMRWVLSMAVGRFGEALKHYVANSSNVDENDRVDPKSFQTDLCSCFDVLYSKWAGDKKQNVRLAVAESLGVISGFLDDKAFNKRFEPLLTYLVQSYRKEKRDAHYPITKGMTSLIEAACNRPDHDTQLLQEHLTVILECIHPLLSQECASEGVGMSAGAAHAIKNRFELLRAFGFLANALPDRLFDFLVSRFQGKSSVGVVGSVEVIRHLVNSMGAKLDEFKQLIMSSCTALVSQPDPRVKRSLIQLVVSMCNQKTYLSLDGADILVRFVVDMCALSTSEGKSAGKKSVSNRQLKMASDRVLAVMAEKFPSTHDTLWPFLLELVNERKLTRAMPVLTHCITVLGEAQQEAATEEQPYALNYRKHVNLPSPQVIAVRLMVLASTPNKYPALGVNVCRAMGVVAPLLHSSIAPYWAQRVPILLKYLRSCEEGNAVFNSNKWCDSLLKMWRESIQLVEDDQEWLRDLCQACHKQFVLYKGDNSAVKQLMRYCGALLAAMQARVMIGETLKLMLARVDNSSSEEREGAAQGFGLCGRQHLDLSLPLITEALKEASKKKKSGWFGSGKEAPDAFKVKSTLVLAYGYVAAYSDPKALLSRLDAHILNNVVPVLDSAWQDTLRVAVVKSVELVAKALHQDRLPESKRGSFKLQHRDRLLDGVLSFIDSKAKHKEAPSSVLRLSTWQTVVALVRLVPPVPDKLEKRLLSVMAPFFRMYIPGGNEEDSGALGRQLIMQCTQVLCALVAAAPSMKRMRRIFKTVLPSLHSSKRVVRVRALGMWRAVLDTAVEAVKEQRFDIERKKKNRSGSSSDEVAPPVFPDMAMMLSPLLVRSFDECLQARMAAIDCVHQFLFMVQLLNAPTDHKPAQPLGLCTDIKRRFLQKGRVIKPSRERTETADHGELSRMGERKSSVAAAGPVEDACLAKPMGLRVRDMAATALVSMFREVFSLEQCVELCSSLCDGVALKGEEKGETVGGVADRTADAALGAAVMLREFMYKIPHHLPGTHPLLPVVTTSIVNCLERLQVPHRSAVCAPGLLYDHPRTLLWTSRGVEEKGGGQMGSPSDGKPASLLKSDQAERPEISSRLAVAGRSFDDNRRQTRSRDRVSLYVLGGLRLLSCVHLKVVLTVLLQLKTPLEPHHAAAFVGLVSGYAPEQPVNSQYSDDSGSDSGDSGDESEDEGKSSSGGLANSKRYVPRSVGVAETDTQLAKDTVKFLIHTVNDTVLEKDKPTAVVMTATDALAAVVRVPVLRSHIARTYPNVLGTALLRIGAAYGKKKAVASTSAVKLMRAVLKSMDESEIIEYASDGLPDLQALSDSSGDAGSADGKEEEDPNLWPVLEAENYDEGITSLTHILCTVYRAKKTYMPLMKALFAVFKNFYSQQAYLGHRVVTTSVLSMFVAFAGSNGPFLRQLIQALLHRVSDKSAQVRKQSLRGLGNVVEIWNEHSARLAVSTLTALTAATEDKNSGVAAEAVKALTRICTVLDASTISAQLVNICFRTRPHFSRPDTKIRRSAFYLFGALCRFGVPEFKGADQFRALSGASGKKKTKNQSQDDSQDDGDLDGPSLEAGGDGASAGQGQEVANDWESSAADYMQSKDESFTVSLSSSSAGMHDDGGVGSNFSDQLHTALGYFLLHLADPVKSVRRSARVGIIQMVPLLGPKFANALRACGWDGTPLWAQGDHRHATDSTVLASVERKTGGGSETPCFNYFQQFAGPVQQITGEDVRVQRMIDDEDSDSDSDSDSDDEGEEKSARRPRKLVPVTAEEVAAQRKVDPLPYISLVVPKLCAFLALEYPRRLRGYLDVIVGKHYGTDMLELRALAASCTGYLLSSMDPKDHKMVNISSVCTKLMGLLVKQKPAVRLAASEALGLLYQM